MLIVKKIAVVVTNDLAVANQCWVVTETHLVVSETTFPPWRYLVGPFSEMLPAERKRAAVWFHSNWLLFPVAAVDFLPSVAFEREWYCSLAWW